MSSDRLKEFYYREINEIKQNKLRFGAIIATFVASVAMFFITDTETEVTAAADNVSPKIVAASNDDLPDDKLSVKNKSDKSASKVTSITGLERASDSVELINPFKSDLPKPPVEKKSTEPAAIPLPPSIPAPTKTVDADSQVVLILKGTAISGDKKMAIIQRSVDSKNQSKKSKSSKTEKTDVSKNESLILNVGDDIDGKRIVDISKDFVVFDTGQRLYIHEAL